MALDKMIISPQLKMLVIRLHILFVVMQYIVMGAFGFFEGVIVDPAEAVLSIRNWSSIAVLRL